jgi:hypothetical protein
MKKTRVQTIVINLPIGSAAEVPVEGKIDLDQSYKSVIGVWAKPDVNGGATRIDIALRDGNGTLDRESSDSKLWGADTGVKPEDMYVPVLYDIASNRSMKFVVTPRGNNLTGAVQVECVMLLSNELIQIQS